MWEVTMSLPTNSDRVTGKLAVILGDKRISKRMLGFVLARGAAGASVSLPFCLVQPYNGR